MSSSAASDPLEALLHRCRREELLRLAAVLRVIPGSLGLGDLARKLAASMRAQGTNAIVAAARGEKSYVDILVEMARKRGVEAPSWPPQVEELEGVLLRAAFSEQWEGLPAAERAALWKELGLVQPEPGTGLEATSRAKDELGRSFTYDVTRSFARIGKSPVKTTWFAAMAMGPLGCFLRPFMIPALLWWVAEPSEERVTAAVLEIARLRQIVVRRVTVGVVGSPSTGKDAAIKALFGIDSGNISPIAGSTKEVAISRLPTSTALYVVNTPGMGDVVQSVTEEAKQVLDHIDVYVYLVNAEGGVQAREKADFARCAETGKPVLAVVNKVDVLRPRDKEKFLADCRTKLGAREDAFLAAAFDPLPELSPAPIGVQEVRAWLRARLVELGKDPGELPD